MFRSSTNMTSPSPSLSGKVILITGASVGLGRQLALELARRDASHIWLAASHQGRLQAALTTLRQQLSQLHPATNCRLTPLPLDLSSFQSIQHAAAVFLRTSPQPLDVLVLNAGVMSVTPGTTAEGYEVQFGINHVGHALLARLLLPALSRASAPRVVVLTSASHRDAPPRAGIRWDALRADGRAVPLLQRYGQSKLANLMYARELARREPWLRVAAVHPGVVRGTELQQRATAFPWVVRVILAFIRWWLTVSLEDGVKNMVWAVECADDELESGRYYEPVGVKGRESEMALREDLAEELWEWTERELDGRLRV